MNFCIKLTVSSFTVTISFVLSISHDEQTFALLASHFLIESVEVVDFGLEIFLQSHNDRTGKAKSYEALSGN